VPTETKESVWYFATCAASSPLPKNYTSARATESLHIEQSPLSLAIKELEFHLAVQLFARTTRCWRSRSLNSDWNLSSLLS
jgi:hypothetical protein